jgi:hypothetical protein
MPIAVSDLESFQFEMKITSAVSAAILVGLLSGPVWSQVGGQWPPPGPRPELSGSEVADQLRTNPGLMNDPGFLSLHPGLRNFLNGHPRARQDFMEGPNDFMRPQPRFNNFVGPERLPRLRENQPPGNFGFFDQPRPLPPPGSGEERRDLWRPH